MTGRHEPCHQGGVYKTPAADDSTAALACQVLSGHSPDSPTNAAPRREPGCCQRPSTDPAAAALSQPPLIASSSHGTRTGRRSGEASTVGLQPPAPPDDAGVPPTPEEPEVDLVAMARAVFGEMLMDVSTEADESRSWRCWVGPGHRRALRPDGTTYCGTCHPATVCSSDGREAVVREPLPRTSAVPKRR